MNKLLKRLSAILFVGLFATAMATSCGQKAAQGDESTKTETAKDSTEHPKGEHPKGEHPDSAEHPTDTTKKN